MKRENNFDLLRLLAASAVFFIHIYALSGRPEWRFIGNLSPALVIDVFFIISGFLIFRSFDQTPALSVYFDKRIRRLLPAYVVVLLCTLLLGVVLTHMPFDNEFAQDFGKFFISNIFFLNFLKPDLPGVFTQNIYSSVNGTLWTIKVEVLFYLCVPLFAMLMQRFGKNRVLFVGYLLSFAYWFGLHRWALQTGNHLYDELGKQLPGQLMYFFAGAVCYYHLNWFEVGRRWFGPMAILVTIAAWLLGLEILYPMALGISVIYFALGFPYLGNFTKYGDLSYGIFLVHFPILQTLIQFGLFDRWPIAAPFVALILTVGGAFILWHLVEKKFLSSQSHYVKTALSRI